MAFTTRQAASEQKTEQEKAAKPSAQLFSDNRASTGIQLKQQQLMQSGESPAQLESAEDEELLQGKFVAQREGMEEEEPLQGKFETLQRAGAEEDELLQGKFSVEQPAQLEQKPNNTGLPNQLKSGIESLSGMSMDNVKVHYNSDKPAQLNAHAYAQGTDIHVAPGQEQHLPHEAWHVVQQAQGRVKPTTQMKGTSVNDDVGLETEADVMGAKATQLKQAEGTSIIQCVPRETDVLSATSIANGHANAHKPHYLDDSKWEAKVKKTIESGEQKICKNGRTAYYMGNGWTVIVSPTDSDGGTAVKTRNKNWFNNLA